jgi:hypothetical protein
VNSFYDAAVSGADPVEQQRRHRAGRERDKVRARSDGADARARKAKGIELVPVDAPTHFTDPSPTAVLIQQILGP